MGSGIGTLALQVLQIVWIDLLLSGDNAVVIAMACRSLPDEQRRWGIILGAGAAVLLRIVFAAIIVQLLALPYVHIIGGVLLLWIAVQLALDEHAKHKVKARSSLFGAVATIVVADGVMSLDNVVAIAGAARGSLELMIFGLLLSVPLIVFGSTLLLKLLERFPIIAWGGAALLGWIAGEMIAAEPLVDRWLDEGGLAHWFAKVPIYPEFFVEIAGIVVTLGIAGIAKRWRNADEPAES
ncbi:MAG: TerC family protein [Methylobacteriaceae bacterium]|nr:TerC family protein [Methylobacteriaceae bacterium]